MINQIPLIPEPPEPLRPKPSPLPQFFNPTPHTPKKLDYIV
jgi:hypothetical protein